MSIVLRSQFGYVAGGGGRPPACALAFPAAPSAAAADLSQNGVTNPMDFLKSRYTPMSRRRRIYEGKAKVLYEGPEPGTLIQHFKDDATAFNAKKHQVIEGKGVLNNRISEYVFQHLNDIGVPTHFIRRLNMREQLICEVEIIPLEIVCRNVAAGSLSQRLGIEEGTQLPQRSNRRHHARKDLRRHSPCHETTYTNGCLRCSTLRNHCSRRFTTAIFGHRYRTDDEEIEQPGYIDSQKIAVNRIDVSTIGKGDQLIWSAISKAPKQNDGTDSPKAVANQVINELIKAKIIGINHSISRKEFSKSLIEKESVGSLGDSVHDISHCRKRSFVSPSRVTYRTSP